MRSLLLAALSLLLYFSSVAQQPLKLEDMEIRDSAGMVYPPVVLQKLLQSGRYTVMRQAGTNIGVLRKLSEEEFERRLSRMPKPRETDVFKTGTKITSFSERDINGVKFSLKELEGKIVVINFWFIGCPPCRQEMPELNELVETYKDNKDVVFIGVSLDQRYEIKDFLKTHPFTYNIIDNGRYITEKYGIHLFPTHLVLDRAGKVLFHAVGGGMNTVNWIKKAIRAGLAGEPLP